MFNTVIGLFDSGSKAVDAIRGLLNAGFARETIRAMSDDSEARQEGGGVMASIKHFLADVGLLEQDTASGVPQNDIKYYADGIRSGKTLLLVYTDEKSSPVAVGIMEKAGALTVDDGAPGLSGQALQEATEGQPQVAPSSGAQTNPQSVRVYPRTGAAPLDPYYPSSTGTFEAYESDFRADFDANHTSTGYTYDHFIPAYRYGYDLAVTRSYGPNWSDVEPNARNAWETRNPGTWDRVMSAVHYAWDKVRQSSMQEQRPAQRIGALNRDSAQMHH